jgi:Protein of unknown function (DUF3716)
MRRRNNRAPKAFLGYWTHHKLSAPQLRGQGSDQIFDITTAAKTVAAAAHLRGETAGTPCQNCQAGIGPFQHCVTVPDFDGLTESSCTNCVWTLNTSPSWSQNSICSFAEGTFNRPSLVLH